MSAHASSGETHVRHGSGSEPETSAWSLEHHTPPPRNCHLLNFWGCYFVRDRRRDCDREVQTSLRAWWLPVCNRDCCGFKTTVWPVKAPNLSCFSLDRRRCTMSAEDAKEEPVAAAVVEAPVAEADAAVVETPTPIDARSPRASTQALPIAGAWHGKRDRQKEARAATLALPTHGLRAVAKNGGGCCVGLEAGAAPGQNRFRCPNHDAQRRGAGVQREAR